MRCFGLFTFIIANIEVVEPHSEFSSHSYPSISNATSYLHNSIRPEKSYTLQQNFCFLFLLLSKYHDSEEFAIPEASTSFDSQPTKNVSKEKFKLLNAFLQECGLEKVQGGQLFRRRNVWGQKTSQGRKYLSRTVGGSVGCQSILQIGRVIWTTIITSPNEIDSKRRL